MRTLGFGVALAVLAASALAGCNSCKKKSEPQARSSSDDDDDDDDRPERNKVRPSSPRPSRGPGTHVRYSAPLALADAVAAMPELDARVLVEPTMTPSGNQARFTYCIDALGIESVGQSVKAKLEAAGWTQVTSRPPTGASAAPRYGVAGQRDDLRLSVTIQGVRRTGCDASVDQYFTVATMNRMAAGAPDDLPQPDIKPTPTPDPPKPPEEI